MKKNYYLTLSEEFIRYCELNNITDIEKAAKETFEKGFTILKYGVSPKITTSQNPLKEEKITNNSDVKQKTSIYEK